MESLNYVNDCFLDIYFIDLGLEENYNILWDEIEGLDSDLIGTPIDLNTLKIQIRLLIYV